MQEARELANDPSTDYSAAPLEDDIFEWHCTLRGPAGTEFEGGLYHFRILLPAEYPFRPPSLMMLTPNGRFELNTKICISFTSYHEELWQPAWGVRTAIIGLQGFFPLKGQAAVGVGSIEYPATERKRLATLSRDWHCPECKQSNLELLPDPSTPDSSSISTNVPPSSMDTSNPAADIALTNSVVTAEESTSSESTSSSETTSSSESSPSDEVSTVDPERQSVVHSVDTYIPRASNGLASTIQPRPASSDTHSPVEAPAAEAAHVTRSAPRSARKPPLLLDTAICVLLVMAFAMICRRII
ncbi:ubiquitin-conjugating enzyme/RWD-like protein [Collybia nuda]|uniref:Ubiquitin-conjugating enzyme/RWD-like protein n=1 Tax=Collybia nuda TaxID=64659 RepID=A0A9P5YCL6_9AGAR|nr:ubiquitin-conjugating enzyme/RWD-like protein [Collybia nuda]